MRRSLLTAAIAVAAGCAQNPNADGLGRPLEDTTLIPGEALNPDDTPPRVRVSVMDSAQSWRRDVGRPTVNHSSTGHPSIATLHFCGP